MTNKAKLAIIITIALTRVAATPAFGQSFDQDEGTGNVLSFSYQSTAPDAAARYAGVRAARRNGLDAFAMDPRPQLNSAPRIHMPFNSDHPALTGSGKIGYNESLKQEP